MDTHNRTICFMYALQYGYNRYLLLSQARPVPSIVEFTLVHVTRASVELMSYF
jgi:hypothetical protein